MKLYCKKTYKLRFYHNSPIKEFLKGKEYEGKFDTIERAITDRGQKSKRKQIENVVSVIGEDTRTIYFTREFISPKRIYYKDYFYTETDMRKQKLEKLNSPINYYINKYLKIFK